MARALLVLLVLFVVLGCGGGSGDSGIKVVVSPHEVTVVTGKTQSFQAQVTGITSDVQWTCTSGTITAGGLFTAPNTASEVLVTATSTTYSNLSDTATVHVVPPSVTINPISATLLVNAKQQFAATVLGYTDTTVQWTATGGSIDSNGLYTAGKVAGSFTVTATSVANPQLKATATVTVKPLVAIAIEPTEVTLAPGATKTFSATVTGTEDTSVTWTCSAGTIGPNGAYVAPETAGTYTVTVVSNADTTKSASAIVNVAAPLVAVRR